MSEHAQGLAHLLKGMHREGHVIESISHREAVQCDLLAPLYVINTTFVVPWYPYAIVHAILQHNGERHVALISSFVNNQLQWERESPMHCSVSETWPRGFVAKR